MFAALGGVSDQSHGEIVGGLVQALHANQHALAIVDRAIRDHILEKAVTLHVNGVGADRECLAERAGNARLDSPEVVVTEGHLAVHHILEARLGRHDRDDAGRGVTAEQGSLRAAQHFDAIERAELGQAYAGAGAVDTVDEHGDRAFEAGVIADRADAADVGARGAGFRRSRENLQRGRDLLDLANVARTRILERFGSDGADGQRHVGQRFIAASRGHDDVAGVDRPFLDRLVVDRRGFGGCAVGGLRRSLVGIGLLGLGRNRQSE